MNSIYNISLYGKAIIIPYLSIKLFKESKAFFKIQKILSTKNVVVHRLPLSIVEKSNYHNNTRKFNQKFINDIVHYYNTIKKEMSNVDLTIYRQNIKSLQISEVNKLEKKNSMANYSTYYNKIQKLKKASNKVLNHELLHMSNSFQIGDSYFMGFSQYHDSEWQKKFGGGINEGYTTLIDQRYFEEVNYSDKYEVLYIVSYMVELIIGKEKMEKFYFSADLYNLIETLKEYNSKSNIIKLINNMDLLLKCDGNTIIEKYYRKKSFKDISNFLIKTYTTKQLNLLYNKKIDEKESEKRILRMIDVLKENVKLNGKLYKLSDISSVYRIVSKLSHVPKEEIEEKSKVYEFKLYN